MATPHLSVSHTSRRILSAAAGFAVALTLVQVARGRQLRRR